MVSIHSWIYSPVCTPEKLGINTYALGFCPLHNPSALQLRIFTGFCIFYPSKLERKHKGEWNVPGRHLSRACHFRSNNHRAKFSNNESHFENDFGSLSIQYVTCPWLRYVYVHMHSQLKLNQKINAMIYAIPVLPDAHADILNKNINLDNVNGHLHVSFRLSQDNSEVSFSLRSIIQYVCDRKLIRNENWAI